MALAFQGTLLGSADPAVDRSFARRDRIALGDDAWVDFVPGWLAGADDLFADVAGSVSWGSPMVKMYDREIRQPRLNGSLPAGRRPAIVEEMRLALRAEYDTDFVSVNANLYRDGRDSVAWHGDRVARTLPAAVVAIVTLGGTRRFLLRPKGGGKSVRLDPAAGDLLVMGGSCQRTWQHSVPKVAHADPRISITFRHKY
jgi:alkylated DNA repair dioxygenase AlkB